MKARSLGRLHSDGVCLDEVRNDHKLVSLILLMTLKPVGVDDLEGGGPGGPDSDGSQQLDVLVLVVERH